MTAIHRSALLMFSARQMFELENDVEAYPTFMDGCVGAQILERSDSHMEARVDLQKGGKAHSFTTLNQLQPFERIELTLKDGPFEHFAGAWQFQALREDACKISLDLEFAVRGGLLASAAGTLFDRVAGRLVEAVVGRDAQLYSSTPS